MSTKTTKSKSNRNRPVRVLTIVAFVFTASHAIAQPPKISSGKSSGNMLDKVNPANWSMPKISMPKLRFPVGSQKRKTATRKEPSLWKKMSVSTRRNWQKTKNFLNPFDNKPRAPKKPSFFDELFTAKEDPKPISTPQDFLSQPRLY